MLPPARPLSAAWANLSLFLLSKVFLIARNVIPSSKPSSMDSVVKPGIGVVNPVPAEPSVGVARSGVTQKVFV